MLIGLETMMIEDRLPVIVPLVRWRSKKQNVVSRSSAEAEYRAMAHTACEMMWVRSLLQEMSFIISGHLDQQEKVCA